MFLIFLSLRSSSIDDFLTDEFIIEKHEFRREVKIVYDAIKINNLEFDQKKDCLEILFFSMSYLNFVIGKIKEYSNFLDDSKIKIPNAEKTKLNEIKVIIKNINKHFYSMIKKAKIDFKIQTQYNNFLDWLNISNKLDNYYLKFFLNCAERINKSKKI